MNKIKEPISNYNATREAIGYVQHSKATPDDYARIGFMAGLEVHQQLQTERKLFCHCPAGIYHDDDDYDAEILRHMRPTLSELGEYDRAALMEFKTRKKITYRLNNETACTYEADDTPPFKIDLKALEISILVALLGKMSIVGEVHVARKQYLDGSYPAGFQRSALIGVEGEIQLRNKIVRLAQLGLEEDACREISDIGHERTFKTDRFGIPLIETVTYPDMVTPDETMEACNLIRFMNRSTGMVRTGIGTGRQDVNVSCKGGHRVEIKGVSHTKWIPELTHNEAFRQWALLAIRDLLKVRTNKEDEWKISHLELEVSDFDFPCDSIKGAHKRGEKIIAVNLPLFNGIVSHFTQPGQCVANEFSDRLRVIACINKPNMITSEDLMPKIAANDIQKIVKALNASDTDAQIIFWSKEEDIPTALETIQERGKLFFQGVPPETRKACKDGTTLFERVLPGVDRMYPETDTIPIPLDDQYIEEIRNKVPESSDRRISNLLEWGVPEDTFTFLLSKNIYPFIVEIVDTTGFSPKLIGTFFGHHLRAVEGKYKASPDFNYGRVIELFKFLKEQNLEPDIAPKILDIWYQYPKMDFDSVLTLLKFKRFDVEDYKSKIPFLAQKFTSIRKSSSEKDMINWIVGQLVHTATGNIRLKELADMVKDFVKQQ